VRADEAAGIEPATDAHDAPITSAEFARALKRRRGERGPQKAPTKLLLSVRLDREVVEHFRGTGPGWQTRMNEVLLRSIGPGKGRFGTARTPRR
jgi:uncharacterized protein (DUF4415 family)